MKIGYVYDQLLRCGGVRVAFEHCRELRVRGHNAVILCKSKFPDIDDWKDKYQVPISEFRNGGDDCDVLVNCWWPMIDELAPGPKKFHLVQGRDKLSYAPGHPFHETIDVAMHRTDIEYLAVSDWAGESCRAPRIVPNGVDAKFFRPAGFPKLFPVFRILLEGSTMDEYKGMVDALAVVQRVKEKNPLNTIECWVISKEQLAMPFVNRWVVNPNDVQILHAYQNSDVLVKATHFDGFGLPHLEAMACGLPLVTTDAGGNMAFCRHDTNCLVTKPKDVDTMVEHVQRLIDSKALRQRFIQNGIMTARKWTWQNSVDKLLEAII